MDGEKPTLVSAVTGEWWNDAEAPGARLKTGSDGKRTSLRVTFSDTSGMEQDSLAPGNFSVDGTTPIAVLLIDLINESRTPPTRKTPLDVFLTLPVELTSDARPTVRIPGEVTDRAGNAVAVGTSREATDGLLPRLTVRLDRTLSREAVEITVESDEPLREPPGVRLDTQANASGGLAMENVMPTASATGQRTYVASSRADSAPSANLPRKINLQVSALELNGIQGTVGASNAELSTAVTYQLDPLLNNGLDPEFTVAGTHLLPGGVVTGGGTAFIDAAELITVVVDFLRQCTTTVCSSGGEAKEYEGDTHQSVEITEATASVTSAGGVSQLLPVSVSSSSGVTFLLSLPGSTLGEYTITVRAKDAAGNVSKTAGSAVPDTLRNRFTVIAATPYELPLAPGWNLISLPFMPSDPSINALIPAATPSPSSWPMTPPQACGGAPGETALPDS